MSTQLPPPRPAWANGLRVFIIGGCAALGGALGAWVWAKLEQGAKKRGGNEPPQTDNV